MKYIILFIFSCLIFTGSLLAGPPPVPSEGIVERELEKEYEGKHLYPAKEIPGIQIDISEEKLEMAEGKKILIRKINILGLRSRKIKILP